MTADQSFLKDLILLALIGFIFINRNKIKPTLNVRNSILMLFFSAIFSVAFMWHVLAHLPVMDCLPFRVNNNIPENMKIPPGAIPDSTVITFVYEKGGKEVQFTAAEFPEDFDESTYRFIRRENKVVRKGNAEPKIRDFSLTTIYANDTTQALLTEDREQLYLFLKNDYDHGIWTDELEAIMQLAAQKNIPGFIVTNVTMESFLQDTAAVFKKMIPLQCDAVAIKTAARANPTLMRIKNGTILGKWSYYDFRTAFEEITKLPANAKAPEPPPELAPPATDSTTNH